MIVLQFVRGIDAGAKLIEWFSHGAEFSHVDSVLPNGQLFGARSDHVGGAPAGVQARDPSYVGDSVTLRIEIETTDKAAADYYNFVMSQAGKPYDVAGIAAFVTGRNWRLPDAWFCSELVTAGLEHCGFFPFPLAAPSNKITPPDLVLLLSAFQPVTVPA